jgi:hypothetical protein
MNADFQDLIMLKMFLGVYLRKFAPLKQIGCL